jgi:hypothetical protein
MSYLVANLPPIECYVRKEYLYDLERGHGDLTPCMWISVKSIRTRALYIESLLTEYGALYDKLPLSAYCWKPIEGKPLPLDHLEIWDAFSYNITVVQKSTLKGLRCAVYGKDKQYHEGEYMFTIDSCHSEPNELNVSLSETPNEHKSFNIVKLNNGQFAAQPNNRMKWFEQSLIAHEVKQPDFKVSTHEFSVEQNPKWSAGNQDEYFYEIEHRTE